MEQQDSQVIVEEKPMLDIQISDTSEDATWDDFIVTTAGGHHAQTSAWGRVKESLGWKTWRVVVYEDGRIVGGAQILFRVFPLVGSAAYVTKGPLCEREDVELVDLILDEVQLVCKKQRCQLLAVQPPNNGSYIEELLKKRSFQKSTLELAPTATLIYDLLPGTDKMFTQMRKTHRKHVRRAIREGVEVIEGCQADLDLYYPLYVATAKRRGFTPFEREYFDAMWENLAPKGWICLLLIACEGEVVSGQILVPFGDTVLIKLMGWSGEHSDCHPNEALIWNAFLWTEAHGYRYCDFEGLSVESVEEIDKGLVPSRSEDYFKFAFGGEAILFPAAYDYVPSPILNWIYRWMPPSVGGKSLLSRLLEWIRKR